MLNRKLEAAVLTLFFGFFIMPFLFSEWRTDFFIIGLIVSAFAAPFVFVIGILFSWWLEKRVTNPVLNVVLHAVAGGIVGALFGWLFLMSLDFITFFLAGLIYAVLFSLVNLLLQRSRFYKKHSGVEMS
ncbi:hypothetical protein MKY84_13135 [Chryseomicrobium sp. FSL W7-1435]|uniref:hypothetical protein n=1 Tax=Chryseomicrobium sp. FSL W7-1435 TaxID=2921704 RepID=UPI00315ADE13